MYIDYPNLDQLLETRNTMLDECDRYVSGLDETCMWSGNHNGVLVEI
ncbi:hypothetical protein SAMN04488029_1717 [Reichenbachiella faecimaris]|uniref:Uncharacterized protein n=1 Tax=Reichenbachiella faecimaris TaxID=692418 RepID=A0A1W2GBI1_REIFA|nr:hypothetical protein [Reichenbachiella faecimaris]SMD33874.1 hypothetical protein SAMN04488029_1717 [Reichenbachiella faecimaris]